MSPASIKYVLAQTCEAGVRWGWQGALSVFDQAAFAGSHFLISILFARWLTAEDYGAYALVYSFFLLAANFHNALVLEPMSVVAPKKYQGITLPYLHITILIHIIVGGLLGLLLALGGVTVIADNRATGHTLGVLGIATPFMLLYWVLRRACYVSRTVTWAAIGSLTYMSVVIAGAPLTHRWGWNSPAAPFLLMSAASIAGSLLLYCRLAFTRHKSQESVRTVFSYVLRQNWDYGRWIAGVAVFYWLANSLYPSLLGIYTGLAAAATLRASENLLAPLSHTMAALTTVLLPWVSSRLVTGGAAYLRAFVVKASLIAGALGAAYAALLLPFGKTVAGLLYGSHPYTGLAVILPVLCCTFVIRGISSLGLTTATKAANFPKYIFLSSVLGAAVSVAFGILLVNKYGVLGAAWGQLVSIAAQTMLVAVFFPRFVLKRV